MSFSLREAAARLTLLKDQSVDREVKLIALLELLQENAIELEESKGYLRDWGILKKQQIENGNGLNFDKEFNPSHDYEPKTPHDFQELKISKDQVALLGTANDKYILDSKNSYIRVYFGELSNLSKKTLGCLKKQFSIPELNRQSILNKPCVLEFTLSENEQVFTEFCEVASIFEWERIEIENPQVSFVLRKRI